MIFCTKNNSNLNRESLKMTLSGELTKSPVSGVLVIDKSPGMSSFGAVLQVKKLLGVKKAGHTGTLDPFATGVLVVCLEQATRIIPFLEETTKEYWFTARFGVETDTWDSSGKVIFETTPGKVKPERIESVLKELMGEIELPLPKYSAVKLNGKRMYKLARKGVEFEPPKRKSTVFEIVMIHYNWPEVAFFTTCSKGTYVRSLAVVIGEKLGLPVYVKELRRLRSGCFTLDNAVTLENVKNLVKKYEVYPRVISMSAALGHLPAVEVSKTESKIIRSGGAQKVNLSSKITKIDKDSCKHVRILCGKDDLVAIAKIDNRSGQLKIIRVFPHFNALYDVDPAGKIRERLQ